MEKVKPATPILVERARSWPADDQRDALSAGVVGNLLNEMADALETLSADNARMREALEKAREAVASLHEDVLGHGSCVVDFHDGREEPYPLRDELLAEIDQVLRSRGSE